jgi:hypothetical protein
MLPLMLSLKARVRGGRLILDEPTDLPEGAEVRVAVVDGDDLSDDERAELHAAIIAAERECDEGHALTEEEFWTRLRKA